MKIESINIEIELTPEQIDVLEPLLAFHEAAAELGENGRILGSFALPNIFSVTYIPKQIEDLAETVKNKMLEEIRAERQTFTPKSEFQCQCDRCNGDETFICQTCEKTFGYCYGYADSNDCDDCDAAKCEEKEKKEEKRNATTV